VPPDSVRCTRRLRTKLLSLGNFQSRRAINHRTVRCTPDCPVYTGQCPVLQEDAALELGSLGNSQRLLSYNSPDMSGVTAGQRLFRRQRLPAAHLLRASARRSQARPYWRTVQSTVHVRCATGHPGGPRSQNSNGRIPTALVTWLAHWTCPVYTGLSGAPYDSQPHQTASLVVGAINTPTTHHSWHPSFPLLNHLKELGIQF
jgi:hypothetical protein